MHQVEAALGLIWQLDQVEARHLAAAIRDAALEAGYRGSGDAGTLQAYHLGLRVRHRKRQDVGTWIAREEALQRRAGRGRIDHGQQLYVAVLQHGAAVADAAIGVACERRKGEAEPLILRGERGEIAGYHAN